jgi:hypothetical protein
MIHNRFSGALAGILLDRSLSTIIESRRGVRAAKQRVARDIKYIEKWSMWSENYSADARECYSSFLG